VKVATDLHLVARSRMCGGISWLYTEKLANWCPS